jgi:hypothetical protein
MGPFLNNPLFLHLYNFTILVAGLISNCCNPRQQVWSEHFIWTSDSLCIIGTTPTGRATCERLDLNDERRGEKFIQKSRQRWVESGLHPPEDDPHE